MERQELCLKHPRVPATEVVSKALEATHRCSAAPDLQAVMWETPSFDWRSHTPLDIQAMAKTRDGCSNGLCSVSKNPAAVKATDFYVKPLTFVHRGHSALVTTKGTTTNKEGPHNQRQKQGQGETKEIKTPVLSRWAGELEGRAGHVAGLVRAASGGTCRALFLPMWVTCRVLEPLGLTMEEMFPGTGKKQAQGHVREGRH